MRSRLLVLVPLVVWSLVGCGREVALLSSADGTTSVPQPGPNLDPDAPIALVISDRGLAGVPVGSSIPRWTAGGAVAAPDGSAVFAATVVGDGASARTSVVRLDPRSGREQGVARVLDGRLHVSAVASGGRVVALAAVAPDGAST